MTFRYLSFNFTAVGKRERDGTLRSETYRLPVIEWQERIRRAAIHKEFQCALTFWSSDRSRDVGDAHCSSNSTNKMGWAASRVDRRLREQQTSPRFRNSPT